MSDWETLRKKYQILNQDEYELLSENSKQFYRFNPGEDNGLMSLGLTKQNNWKPVVLYFPTDYNANEKDKAAIRKFIGNGFGKRRRSRRSRRSRRRRRKSRKHIRA